MKCLLKAIVCIATFLISSMHVTAQVANLDSAKAELYRINKVFDSSRYLAFDVSLIYDTDTLFGKFEHQEVYGSYIINNKNLYSKLDKTEYIQTDSFVYNIYNEEKTIMMTKDPVSNSNLFPVREFVDSIMTWYDTSYIITLHTEDSSIRVIEFAGCFTNLPYTRFAVYYQEGSYFPERFEMSMQTEFDLSEVPDSLLALVKLKPMQKKVSMNFFNYHTLTSIDVFDDTKYAVYDRTRKFYRLTPKYRGYRFLTNGVEGEEVDEAVELSSPNNQ